MARSTGSTTAGQKAPRSPGAPPLGRLSQWGLVLGSQPWQAYPVAFLASALAALLRWGLGVWVGPTLSPFATFYPLILFVALLGGTGPGLLATVLSVLAVDFFFLPPRGFAVALPADRLGLAIFFGTNIAVSFVCGALRSARQRAYAEARRAHASEERFRILFETSPLSTFLIDPDTQRILDCNQQAGDSLGYTCEQLCQLRIPDIEAHLASEQIAGVVSQVAQGRQLSFETRHRT
ncbi:MAG TPA: DUF4118 domain-containing protein, partial [Candidatus Sulfotelmatobacter sp.]|nr:DUF4118 domain-containing protein [Candidatus Sulfotelmatobacter sp.]